MILFVCTALADPGNVRASFTIGSLTDVTLDPCHTVPCQLEYGRNYSFSFTILCSDVGDHDVSLQIGHTDLLFDRFQCAKGEITTHTAYFGVGHVPRRGDVSLSLVSYRTIASGVFPFDRVDVINVPSYRVDPPFLNRLVGTSAVEYFSNGVKVDRNVFGSEEKVKVVLTLTCQESDCSRLAFGTEQVKNGYIYLRTKSGVQCGHDSFSVTKYLPARRICDPDGHCVELKPECSRTFRFGSIEVCICPGVASSAKYEIDIPVGIGSYQLGFNLHVGGCDHDRFGNGDTYDVTLVEKKESLLHLYPFESLSSTEISAVLRDCVTVAPFQFKREKCAALKAGGSLDRHCFIGNATGKYFPTSRLDESSAKLLDGVVFGENYIFSENTHDTSGDNYTYDASVLAVLDNNVLICDGCHNPLRTCSVGRLFCSRLVCLHSDGCMSVNHRDKVAVKTITCDISELEEDVSWYFEIVDYLMYGIYSLLRFIIDEVTNLLPDVERAAEVVIEFVLHVLSGVFVSLFESVSKYAIGILHELLDLLRSVVSEFSNLTFIGHLIVVIPIKNSDAVSFGMFFVRCVIDVITVYATDEIFSGWIRYVVVFVVFFSRLLILGFITFVQHSSWTVKDLTE